MGSFRNLDGTSKSSFSVGREQEHGINIDGNEVGLFDPISGPHRLSKFIKGYDSLREMYEPTGFPNLTDSAISFNDGTRKFTIAPTGVSFYYYIRTEKYVKSSAEEVPITDTEGLWVVYYDGATLTASQSIPNDIFWNKAIIAWLYWDADNNKAIYFGDERHGYQMDGGTHKYLHDVFGAKWLSGIGAEGMVVDGDGSNNTHAQVGFGSGVIRDEDLTLAISSVSSIVAKNVYYRTGASGNWRLNNARAFPVLNYSGGSGRLAWNQLTGGSWQQTEAGQSECILTHAFATNDPSRPVIFIQGQNVYATVVAAREGAKTEMSSLILGGMPFAEFVPIATFIFQTSTTYSNTPKARIRSTGYGNYVDWRATEKIAGVGNVEAITAEQHKSLQQLIHFIDDGPADGFASGAYRETTGTIFPTAIAWYVSSAKTKKIVERLMTWTGAVVTVDKWKIYASDGVAVSWTVTDAVSYTGLFETSRTRTIASGDA